jgi:hypothetical protein
VEEFASHRVATYQARAGSKPLRPRHLYEVRNPIRQMLRLALEGRITLKRRQKPHCFVAEAPGFLEYLATERGLSENTVRHYLYSLERLGNYLNASASPRSENCRPHCWHLSSSPLLPAHHAPLVVTSVAKFASF